MTLHAPGLAAAALAAAALFGPTAHAAPVFQLTGAVNAIAITNAPGPQQVVQHTDSFNLATPPAAPRTLVQEARTSNGGLAWGRVDAQSGVLKNHVVASYPGQSPITPVNGYAWVGASVGFADTVRVQGPGLAVGTPVRYAVDVWIDGNTSQPAFEPGGHLAAQVTADIRIREIGGDAARMLSWDSWRNADGWYSLVIDTEVGQDLLLSALLQASATVDAFAQHRFAEADYGHSLHYHLRPSIAGLNTVGASGHDFVRRAGGGDGQPVPAPATLALLLPALAGLAFSRGRSAPARG